MAGYSLKSDRPMGSYRKSDSLFLICVLLLWGLGIFTIFVCTQSVGERFFNNRYYFLYRQLFYSVPAFAGFVFFAVTPMKAIRKMILMFAFVSIVLCLMALLPGIGSSRNGAARWISIPHLFTFQPSELVKFTMCLYLANLFDRHSAEYEENRTEFKYPVCALILFSGVIALQKDLSTCVLVFIVGIALFLVSGAPVLWMIPMGLLVAVTGALMILMEPYRLMRVLAYICPEKFTTTAGYQSLASARAINAGGVWGVGTGSGLDAINGIPEIQTDYIFAGWATSMGLVGVTMFFFLLCFFAYRGFRIAMTGRSRFASFASYGCVFSMVLQAVFNCAVVSGAAPTTGIPLPFFSSGGSSLIVTMCMCGFVINASHCDADDSMEEYVPASNVIDLESESFTETVVEL